MNFKLDDIVIILNSCGIDYIVGKKGKVVGIAEKSLEVNVDLLGGEDYCSGFYISRYSVELFYRKDTELSNIINF